MEGWGIGWVDWFGPRWSFFFGFLGSSVCFAFTVVSGCGRFFGVLLLLHLAAFSSVRISARRLAVAYLLLIASVYGGFTSGYVFGLFPRCAPPYGLWLVYFSLYCVPGVAGCSLIVFVSVSVRP
ncbi:hypothetical protein [Bacteroides graminisolvens]|uniref:hypothetical protein n=1 Tax=Bacteroides graminisolvens TaxID=477666 RepID=UPI00040DB6EF|nr:hypothetical protein [Bacteroides graminisolvens]